VARRDAADRYARLEKVVQVLRGEETFTLAQAKAKLPQERPAYVTRVAHQLEREGHLRRGKDRTFSWVAGRDFPAEAWLQGQVYGPQLPQTPEADRPRERLLAHGAAALRTAELLAILIRSGRTGESALQAGERLAARYGEQLERLPQAGPGDLKAVTPATGETAYCQIMAGIELGRRVAQAQNGPQQAPRLLSSGDALRFCRERFARLASDGAQEEFHVVCLDTKHQVLGTHRSLISTPYFRHKRRNSSWKFSRRWCSACLAM
jgi:DNA repair protein RadC